MLILSALGLSFLTTKTFLGELSFVSFFFFAVQIKRVRLCYFLFYFYSNGANNWSKNFRRTMSIADKANDLILTGPRSTKVNFPTKSSLYNSPGDEKRAKGLRWVFYKKYDCRPFVLTHNSPFWPDISLADKLSMVRVRKLYFKATSSGRFKASFVKMMSVKEVDSFVLDVSTKVANANKSLSDISSIALVHTFRVNITFLQFPVF